MDSYITWPYQKADHNCRITWVYNKYQYLDHLSLTNYKITLADFLKHVLCHFQRNDKILNNLAMVFFQTSTSDCPWLFMSSTRLPRLPKPKVRTMKNIASHWKVDRRTLHTSSFHCHYQEVSISISIRCSLDCS